MKASIEGDDSLVVVAEASDGNEALCKIVEYKPDVTVLDIDMPGLNGLGVAREATAQNLGTRIIFMIFHADEDLMRTAIMPAERGIC